MPLPTPRSTPFTLRNSLSTEVLIIGGGATGLGIAWDASLRGLKVILIEQSDVGQGTSGRYHGLLHSGARYAVSDPQTARECAQENIILRSIAAPCIEDTGGYFLSTPADPLEYPDRWLSACQQHGIPAEELPVERAREFEPALSPRLSRAFQVNDASLDSFDLAQLLINSIRSAGGQVYLHHRVTGLIRDANRVTAVEIEDLRTGYQAKMGAEVVVNATGPWATRTAKLAQLEIPMTLGKGTMVAMASRPIHTILNRCNPPSDGDIIVPVGTVIVLGTTNEPVQDPTDLKIEPWEVDLLLAEAEFILPDLRQMRALRAWAGIRPLYSSNNTPGGDSRSLARGHVIVDHEQSDGCSGIISVIGGKLTTFRMMAEQTVDLVCKRLEHNMPCKTRETLLSSGNHSYFQLPGKLDQTSSQSMLAEPSDVICECEQVTREQLIHALDDPDNLDLDAIRRDLRLGMGPCQAGYCALRTFGLLCEISPEPAPAAYGIRPFLMERWRGQRPVGWGHSLRQMEFSRRLYQELLGMTQEEYKP